jgi:hypothetical protein
MQQVRVQFGYTSMPQVRGPIWIDRYAAGEGPIWIHRYAAVEGPI